MDWSHSTTQLVLTGLIGLFTLIVFLFVFIRRKSHKQETRDAVVICGPSGGGKTLLTYRLCLDKAPTTIMSMKPSILEYAPTSLPIVDFPGHPRLRSQLYSKYLNRAHQLIFLFDSADVQNQAREAAELLYDLFTNPLIDKVTKFHLVCNKTDLSTSRPLARVKLTLQQELEKIRKTRTSLEEGDEQVHFMPLGRTGKPFSFEHDCPIDIVFSSLSVKNDSLNSIIESIGL